MAAAGWVNFIRSDPREGSLDRDNLKAYATAVGLEREAFDSCLDGGKYRGFIAHEEQAAREAGARGASTFLVNGQLAFPDYVSMATAIQAELDG